ncbi:MAG: class I SAM-dependent methyltransferase, partial [Candidatus Omnitrophica bacterium]|nr:class I SAM-dependent methyltransferase [Candidatus Omnitrophota bacterium]
MNTAKILIRSPRDLYKIDSHYAFHSYLVNQALTRYQNLIGKDDLGSALGICCTEVEATHFAKYPFSKIVLTDIHEANDKVKEALAKNKKMSYGIENAESLSYPDGSFDLVFCKEGLHHLARPMLGLYEMLRVCRKAVIIVEPYETWLGNILEKFNLTSV